MAATRLGIPMPAQVNTRPSGRYKVQAPDAPNGSVLRVITRDGTMSFVEVVCPHGRRLFVDLNRELIDFSDWEYATRVEVESFRAKQRIASCADEVELRGAPVFVATIPAGSRNELLAVVADELRVRGKSGKADQLLAYLRTK